MTSENLTISAFKSFEKYAAKAVQKVVISPSKIKYSPCKFNLTSQDIGKHKIPRFLYHITNKKNYESIFKDGFIKQTVNDPCPGVYMVELSNLFKRWSKSPYWKVDNLKKKLINHARKNSNDILVMLKIKTSALAKNKLIVRSQDIFFKEIDKMRRNYRYMDFDTEEEIKNQFPMIFNGIPAKNSSLLKKRKQSIEYIYPMNIQTSCVEKIGEINFEELIHSNKYDLKKEMKSIYSALLKGQPEEKAANLLKD